MGIRFWVGIENGIGMSFDFYGDFDFLRYFYIIFGIEIFVIFG